MLIAILKANGIRKVVASAGSKHMNVLMCVQQDPYFEVYSEVDERNAAYMACGLAAESGEPVVITCTGATAPRNYLPGLSEAYYRKLPILAITCSQDMNVFDNLSPQFVNNSIQPIDAVKYSVHIPVIKDKNDEWDVNLKLNRAVSELFRHGRGPVHINLTTDYLADFYGVQKLPETRIIRRYCLENQLPEMPKNKRIAITVGAHPIWDEKSIAAVDRFCSVYNAIVLCDHSSNYHGKYRVFAALAASQEKLNTKIFDIDLLIHIGEQSGDYYVYGCLPRAKEVWRVSEDGEMRDTFKKLTKVFEMSEYAFFSYYAEGEAMDDSYLNEATADVRELYSRMPEFPLSNIWVAKQMTKRIPKGAAVHIGVSNTQRSWNFFDTDSSVLTWVNAGCRGIDGALPAVVGMSLAEPERIHYCILGDLTFFCAMNILGNRHIGGNLRIVLINNGQGAEFRIYQHKAQRTFGADSDLFIAGGGHYGNKSRELVKNFAENLGFTYFSVESKEDFEKAADIFMSDDMTNQSMLMEVFTEIENEDKALKLIRTVNGVPEA